MADAPTYPPLPPRRELGMGLMYEPVEGFNVDDMRAFVDADRAARTAQLQPQPQPAQPLTDSQIKAAVHGAVKSGRLSWMGYEKDEAGEYTVPVLSPSHYQLARAIEAALTAPSTPTPPEVAP